MEEILKKFSPKMTSDLVGDEISFEKNYPQKEEKVFDLHGYTKFEAEEKFSWILHYCEEKDLRRIKIITGIGAKILLPAIRQKLKTAKEKQEIAFFEEGSGVFEVFL